MSFKIVVTEVTRQISDDANSMKAVEVERYAQTVEELDLRAVMAAVNHRPRKPRVRKDAK